MYFDVDHWSLSDTYLSIYSHVITPGIFRVSIRFCVCLSVCLSVLYLLPVSWAATRRLRRGHGSLLERGGVIICHFFFKFPSFFYFPFIIFTSTVHRAKHIRQAFNIQKKINSYFNCPNKDKSLNVRSPEWRMKEAERQNGTDWKAWKLRRFINYLLVLFPNCKSGAYLGRCFSAYTFLKFTVWWQNMSRPDITVMVDWA